jgi:repressor LexA
MLPTRRQKAVLEAIKTHVAETGQMPTLHEIARRCGLSSVATVHRHIALLQERGLLRRRRSRRRGIELRPAARCSPAVAVPILGKFAPGRPIEALSGAAPAAVPRDMVAKPADTFALIVGGDALRGEQILDGDVIVLEGRARPAEGMMVVAIGPGENASLKTVRRDRGRVHLAAPDGAGERGETRGEDLIIHGVVLGLLRRFE